MKKIVICHDETNSLTLIDDDDADINSYSKEISKVLESSKICILETSSGNAILKPSKINSIFVTELSSPEINEQKVSNVKTKVVANVKKIMNNEDVIKD